MSKLSGTRYKVDKDGNTTSVEEVVYENEEILLKYLDYIRPTWHEKGRPKYTETEINLAYEYLLLMAIDGIDDRMKYVDEIYNWLQSN